MSFRMSELPNKYYLIIEKAIDGNRWLSVFVNVHHASHFHPKATQIHGRENTRRLLADPAERCRTNAVLIANTA
jgi:hypothetical protein